LSVTVAVGIFPFGHLFDAFIEQPVTEAADPEWQQ
jgi:hypothetical protein